MKVLIKMIYTITLNPSLDYIVLVENFTLNMTNRTNSEMVLVGGKGINVSLVLKNLGHKSTALGFVGGFVGDEITNQLMTNGIDSQFIRVSNGVSRINVKIRNIDGTEINGQGPEISKAELCKLLSKLTHINNNDILVLAGSIPASISNTIYKEIMQLLPQVRIVVDATKELLLNVLELQPFLIKPNNYELGEIFEVKLTTQEEVIPYAEKLQVLGAKNVLVSLGANGAVLVTETGKVYQSDAPTGMLINSVGAGDSMVAGFIAGYLETNDLEHAFKFAVCTGSASAFSENLATKESVLKLYNDQYEVPYSIIGIS